MTDITDTYDAACIAIVRAALAGQITSREAVKRIERARLLAEVARYGVAVAEDELESARKRLGLAL